MKGEWCYFKSQFNKKYCDHIIETIKKRPANDATVGVQGADKLAEQVRRSKIRFIQKNDNELGYLFDDLWKLALIANDQWFNFHISKLDYMQVAEYDGAYQGEYKRHHDIFYMNNDPYYHRKLSCIVQLSDPNTYAGGDLELYELTCYPNKSELKDLGTVIFFPSFTSHAALPVTDGLRYSIAAWFDGPKWC
jgi:PKHD-type hydroxylase